MERKKSKREKHRGGDVKKEIRSAEEEENVLTNSLPRLCIVKSYLLLLPRVLSKVYLGFSHPKSTPIIVPRCQAAKPKAARPPTVLSAIVAVDDTICGSETRLIFRKLWPEVGLAPTSYKC